MVADGIIITQLRKSDLEIYSVCFCGDSSYRYHLSQNLVMSLDSFMVLTLALAL
jgi:hypothetical protein